RPPWRADARATPAASPARRPRTATARYRSAFRRHRRKMQSRRDRGRRRMRLRLPSLRQHLDVAVDARDHLELALEDLALVAGNGAIFAFGEDHAREGADRFLDRVAAGREHRPGGVGERLA